ncbi:MAG: 2-hydroxyacyl-CoA dehydratase family protein [Dehalococcoidia bacterium]|nr:2-hydroxyacyl-CoA dehydratase family protein [Dehalococcoidia bacterium]
MGQTNPLRSARLGSQATDQFYEDLRKAAKKGDPVCWILGALITTPMVTSMGIPWVFADALAAHLAARHQQKRPEEVAEEKGYLRETCSYTRIHMGCTLLSDEDRAKVLDWQVPNPDFVIITDGCCSEWVEWGDDVRKRFKVPIFTLHVPFLWNDKDRDEATNYVVGQLKEMNTFLEDTTRRKQDWIKLAEIINMGRQAQDMRAAGQQLCRNIPAPATIFDWATALGAVFNSWGKPQSVEIYKSMKQEMEERVARKEGAVVGEKYRLCWDGMIVWPEFGPLSKKLASRGANVVTSAYMWGFFPTLMDPTDPLKSIAWNMVDVWANRNLDWQINHVAQLCEDYKVDGLICHAHYTCRALCGQQLELMDAVSRRLDIPAIFIEADVGDESFYSEAQVDTRLQALLEMIDAKRKRRA